MFTEKRIMFLYVETPLHAGTGRGLGAVDLPIQRERSTGYPMVQASSIKGRLRDIYRNHHSVVDNDPIVTNLFGKAGEAGESFAGSISPGDARLLLFPVRSLSGVFAWTTSIHVLENFYRSARFAGNTLDQFPNITEIQIGTESALVGTNTDLAVGNSVVLEEFSFTPRPDDRVTKLGEELAKIVFSDNYNYWKGVLPKKLCILPENSFRDFCMYATEIQTHIHLDENKKTVLQGQLWTTESLPIDTLLYSPILASGARYSDEDKDNLKSASEILKQITDLNLKYFQLGGDETTGQGWVTVKIWGGTNEQ